MKLKIIFLFLVLISTINKNNAQHVFSGHIKSKHTNENLKDVSIYFSDLKIETNTNDSGNFKINSIQPGSYLVEISMIGFKKKVERFNIDRDLHIQVVLTPAVSELNEVVVTAVTHSTELKHSPIIIKPVDIGVLREQSSTNLIDALKNIPGVNQITTGAGVSKPIVRGLGYNRIITLYNGIRQEGQQWGDEHGIEIDEYAVDRIEVVKGPGSLIYGSDGIAGVLNFISPKAPPMGQIRTQFISNYQSNNNLIGYSIFNSGHKKDFQWLGRWSNKFVGNYKNKYDERVYNSGFQEYDGSVFLGITKKWGYSHLNISTFNTTLNMIEGERDSLGRFVFQTPDGTGSTQKTTALPKDLKGYRIGFPHQSVKHKNIQLNHYIMLPKGANLLADLGFQNNKRQEYGDVLNPDVPELYFNLNTLNYNLKYNFKDNRKWHTSIGVSGMQQTNTNKGESFLIPDYRLFDIGGYVFTQKYFSKVTVVGGLRIDQRNIHTDQLILDSLGVPTHTTDSSTQIKFEALSKQFKSFSGSIGLTCQINKQSNLKFNISRGFRAPNISELASNGQHEGSLRYEYGNINLKPEISHQIDLAYFFNSDHFTFEITPFANIISNYIFSEKLINHLGNDSIPDPLDLSSAFRFTQGDAKLIGGEIFIDVHPHPLDWLHLENSFSFVKATQNNQPDSTKYLPFIPAPKYRCELKATTKTIGKGISNGYAKLSIDHYFSQNQVYSAFNTETTTPSYTLIHVGLGIDIKAFKKIDFIKAIISGENLTNRSYQSHLNRLKYAPENPFTGRVGVFNMGRNLSLKLILSI